MLTISDGAYRELQRIALLRKARRISKAQLRQFAAEILARFRLEEQLRKEKEESRRKKHKLRLEFRQKLRSCDAGCGKRGGPFVQGGLPFLGKRR